MVELQQESSAWSMSPRLSFSHDFPDSGADGIPVDRRPLIDSQSDFQFFSGEPPLAEYSQSSPADELFSDGRILAASMLQRSKPPPAPTKETLREIMKTPEQGSDHGSSKPRAGSSKTGFWRFGRSSSLNSYGDGSKRSLFGKLPLLHRSNSTGFSDQTQKKDPNKSTQNPKRHPAPNSSSPCSVSSPPAKPLLTAKKGGAGVGGRLNPVLNVPPPYISAGTANLFGFRYFFRSSRDSTISISSKNKKKIIT